MRLIISSPEGIIFNEEVHFVVVTLVDGELGILPRRENFIGALDEGPIKIQPQEKIFFAPGGLLMKNQEELHLMVPFLIEAHTYEEYWKILEEKYIKADERMKKLKEIKL